MNYQGDLYFDETPPAGPEGNMRTQITQHRDIFENGSFVRCVEETIRLGDAVRVMSWAGPCLDMKVIGFGPKRFKLEFGNGSPVFEPYEYTVVHKTPCERCTDYPHTQYPRGYEG